MKIKSFLQLAFLIFFQVKSWAIEVPAEARVVDVNVQGSGCNLQNSSVLLSPDATDLSLFFEQYSVEIGRGSENPNLLKLTKECQIRIQLAVPMGWQMAFKGADYRGFVNLPSQGSAFHRFSIIQAGAPIVSMREAFMQGTQNRDYYVRSEVRPERVTWSQCFDSGLTSVNLISQLGVSLNPRQPSRDMTQIVLDSADTSFKQSLSIAWRRCQNSRAEAPGSEIPPRSGHNPVRPPRYGGR